MSSLRALFALLPICLTAAAWSGSSTAWTPLPAPGQSVLTTAKEPTVLAVAKNARILVTALKGNKSVAFYHPDTGALLGSTGLPKEAVAVALTDDGTRAYALYDSDISVAVIDTATRTITATWRVAGSPVEPDAGAGQGMALNTTRNELLVLDKSGQRVIALSTQTGAVLGTKPLGRKPELISLGGSASVLIGLDNGQLVVLDAATLAITRTIALGEDLRALAWWWQGTTGARALAVTRKQDALAIIDTATGQVARVPLSDKAEGVEIEQQDNWAYVTAKDDDTLSLIDLLRQALTGYYTLPGPTGNLFFDPAANAGTGALYITLTKDDKLLRLDPRQASLIRKITVAKTLLDVAVNTTTHEALAVSSADPDLARIKLADRTVTTLALPDKAAKVAVDAARNLAIVGDTKKRLLFVDLATTPATVYPERITLQDDAVALAVDATRGLTVVGAKGEKRVELVNNHTRTLSAGVALPEKIDAIALHAGKGMAYLVTDDKRLRLLNLDTRALGQVVNLSFDTEGIAVDETLNLAVLVTKDNDRAHLLDLNTLQMVASLPLPKNPIAVAIQPDTHIAVVVSKDGDRISLIDLTARTVTPEFNKLDKPTAVAVSTRYNQALIVSADKDALTLVQLPSLVPTIATLTPARILTGTAQAAVQIAGAHFVDGLTVLVDDIDVSATWLSPQSLTIQIPGALLTSSRSLSIRVVNPGPGGGASNTIQFAVVDPAPVLQSVVPVTVPADGMARSFSLVGQHISTPISVLVDGVAYPGAVQSETAATVSLPGSLFITPRTAQFALRTASGDSSDVSVTIRPVLPPPAFLTLDPAGAVRTNISPLRITGQLSGASSLTAAGQTVPLQADGSFSFDQTLQDGPNLILLDARNADGIEASRTVSATLDTLPPQPVVMSLVTLTAGAGSLVLDGAAGSAEAGTTIRVTNLRTGLSVAATVQADGSFNVQAAGLPGDTLQLTLVDPAGNISASAAATVPAPPQNLPPDPATIAPPVAQGVTTLVSESTAFLYTGTNPIQTGVTPGTIEAWRAAVVRGRTLDREGTPLTGVTVSVMGHPELGKTLTRADGVFDLAVNGGGEINLRYEKAGHLPVQRRVRTRWQAFANAEDVVLIALDAIATAVSLPSPAGQTAQGSVSSDADGPRRATVFFPAGTTAQMVLPDGSIQPMTSLTVRATEYTVGSNGRQTMPAPLPPASGYTYAVELSVDEAIAADAREVQFSQPVPVYVDNFIGFPVGTSVPSGYFNRDANVWLPSKDGVVIKVVGVQAGLALVDYSGDDAPDDTVALGMTDSERAMLASRFAVGKSAWRVPVPHFSPWDFNWPFGLPPDVREPQMTTAVPDVGEVKDECDEECGSIIDVQNRVLKEVVGIAGTSFALHYGTDRVPGGNQVLRIPVSGQTVPNSLAQIELRVEVAGQVFTQNFPAIANQTAAFFWDGKDAYGRAVQGTQQAAIRISYKYTPVAYSTPASLERSFGSFGTSLLGNTRRSGDLVSIAQEYSITLAPTGLGGWDAKAHQGMGGWTIDAHHAYDPTGRVLHMGNGRRRSAESLSGVIVTSAGTGVSGFNGDGIPATAANLSGPRGVAAGPDGSIYISDNFQNRIRKVSPDGIISTIAGTGVRGFSGDGGPAISALLSYPAELTLGPDGSVYFIDMGNSRIRRIHPDGTITTVAGNGAVGFSGDGVSADIASLNSPASLAVAADGTLYIADTNNHRIRRVDKDGIIWTIAGRSSFGFAGDGGPAKDAFLNRPTSLAFDANENLYISDFGNNRIRKISPDGMIRSAISLAITNAHVKMTIDQDGALLYVNGAQRVFKHRPGQAAIQIAGTGEYSFGGNGVSALQSAVFPDAFAVMPDGTLLMAEQYFNRVRMIRPALSGFDVNDVVVAGPDGSEVHVFTSAGRHLRTHHAKTGAVLRSFGYENGLLTEIRDGDGNVTRIERGANGVAQAIVSADGQRTTLGFDSNGWLERITNPANESFSMASQANGLLTRFTSPRNFSSTFEYEANGLLKRDRNAANGEWRVSQTSASNGRTVTMTSAEGRMTDYQVETLANGDDRRTSYFPDGTMQQRVLGANHVNTYKATDGTVTTETEAPDPRFGMQSAFAKALSIVTPSGLTLSRTVGMSATLADPRNPLSLVAEVTTVTENGRITRSQFDAANRQTTITSPQNRITLSQVDTQGRPTLRQVPNVLPLQIGYDSRGRLDTLTQGSGPAQRRLTYRYSADGFVDKITDAETRETLLTRDPAGRVRQATLPGNRVLDMGFDAASNLNALTPPGKPAHTFDHTPVDRVSAYSPPQAGLALAKTTYGYNLDQQLTSVTRPDGITVTLGYQPNGRLATVTPSANGDTVTYGYQPNSGQLNAIATGGADAVTIGMTYDGFLPKADTVTGALVASLNRGYDTSFRLNQLTLAGTAYSLGYDNDGLLTQAGSLVLTRRADNGFLSGTTLGIVTTEQTYNPFGEVETFTAKVSGNPVYGYTLAYDKLGRIHTKTETRQGTTTVHEYTHDLAGRLETVKADGVTVRIFAYDGNGNRTHVNGVQVATYDDQDRLQTYAGASFEHGANGELKRKIEGSATTQYQYDVFGNLKNTALPNATNLDYLVDGRHRRIGKKVNGTVTKKWLYQDQLRIAAELDQNNTVTTRFIHGTKANVPEYITKGSDSYRIVTDHLGSVRLVIHATTGAVVQSMLHDEWGNVTQDTNPGFQPFGFAGGLYDQDTGLVRFGARDYDPATGRWNCRHLQGGYEAKG